VKNIYVGNLGLSTSEEALRQAFAAFGQVNRVSIMTDRDTGQPRGFGFVEMANATDADKAIAALNGTLLDERASNVNEARPKKEPGSLRPRLPGPWRKALVVPAGSILTCPMLASPHKSQFYKAGSNPASHFLPEFV